MNHTLFRAVRGHGAVGGGARAHARGLRGQGGGAGGVIAAPSRRQWGAAFGMLSKEAFLKNVVCMDFL